MSEIGLNQIFNVFVSHAYEDMELVNQFADVLSWNNINPLVAEYIQEPGKLLWKEKIRRLINECHYFVVLYTYNAQNKVKVHQEIGSAGILDRRIIVLLEGGIDQKTLPGYLEGLEVVENFNRTSPCDGFNSVTHVLLSEWYSRYLIVRFRREITQFYGCHATHGKIQFKFDETSQVWNRYRLDSSKGNWVLI